ncbi:MAG: GNAT family N-acetyltransferase [Rhizomicrobium sp.]
MLQIDDIHFAWMLGEAAAPAAGLRLPAGGVDTPEILGIVRGMTRRLHAGGSRGSWMMVSHGEVVGLCSFKQPPKDGAVEIGYASRPPIAGRGHASRAVAAMLDCIRADPALRRVTAATAITNIASQRVLARNGFGRTGSDPDDGGLVFWTHDLG